MTLAPLTLPRRSVLYVPGSNARALAKSASLPADGLILDLEDAVLPAAKLGARAAVLAAVAEQAFGHREVVVRINALDTEWGMGDLQAAALSGVDGILLPKVEGAATLLKAAYVLEQMGAPDSLRLWSMAETPRGILNLDAIARCTPRLSVIVLGTADLGKALRVPEVAGRAALVPALAHCVLAARAAGLDILDGVYARLTDLSGFEAECLQGRQLGFDGKTLLHPDQLPLCNDAFGVSATEAAGAAELIAAWEAAAASGAGVAVHEGRLVERLHVEAAQRQLALYQTIHDRTMPTQAPGTRPA
ncbi:MAG: CoA ester lyase [Gammaproteobacteria bacterium]|nr:CoA ester lyase [Gammaproteobacteria bacterium]